MILTEEQKETIRFYTTNDYLLINGLLWKEDRDVIKEKIKIINEDGRAVMQEAVHQGFCRRWNCSDEEGERIYQQFQKRFPVINSESVIDEIIKRAEEDISVLYSCMEPLQEDMVLYRNIKTVYLTDVVEGEIIDYRGFSSCSMKPHAAENAEYGSSNCSLVIINVPKGTPAIRLDLMEDIANESDEIILPPLRFMVNTVNEKAVYMSPLA